MKVPERLDTTFSEGEMRILVPGSEAAGAARRARARRFLPVLLCCILGAPVAFGLALFTASAVPTLVGMVASLLSVVLVNQSIVTVRPRELVVREGGVQFVSARRGQVIAFDELVGVRVEVLEDGLGDQDTELVLEWQHGVHRERILRPEAEWLAAFVQQEWDRASRLKREGSTDDVPPALVRMVEDRQ